MNLVDILEKLAALRSGLETEGVEHLAVFGSRARGDFGPASDLDLLIDVVPSGKFSVLNLVGVEHMVADSTGLKANAFMRRSLDASFRKAISADVIEVF